MHLSSSFSSTAHCFQLIGRMRVSVMYKVLLPRRSDGDTCQMVCTTRRTVAVTDQRQNVCPSRVWILRCGSIWLVSLKWRIVAWRSGIQPVACNAGDFSGRPRNSIIWGHFRPLVGNWATWQTLRCFIGNNRLGYTTCVCLITTFCSVVMQRGKCMWQAGVASWAHQWLIKSIHVWLLKDSRRPKAIQTLKSFIVTCTV